MSFMVPVREVGMRKRVHAAAWYVLEKKRDWPIETVCGRLIPRGRITTGPEVTCKACLKSLKAREK